MPSAHRARLLSTADFACRLLFFAAAPFLLVFIAEVFPITGALLQIGLALLVFFTAEAVRRLTGRSRLLERVLATQLRFEAHYRAHPPRAFLYYVFCPLLLPHWLWTRAGRRELWLYKGFTWVAFVLLLGYLLVQFTSNFPPELTLTEFLPLALMTFGVETLAVLMFMMPLVTSVVQLHMDHAPRRLAVLLLVGMVSVGVAVVRVEQRRSPIVSYSTRTRVRLRQQADPQRAFAAEVSALKKSWAVLPEDRQDIARDGRVEGAALAAARSGLMEFYKNDEAFAFSLWFTRVGGKRSMVVYFPVYRGRDPVWLAMDRRGEVSADLTALSPRLRRSLGR